MGFSYIFWHLKMSDFSLFWPKNSEIRLKSQKWPILKTWYQTQFLISDINHGYIHLQQLQKIILRKNDACVTFLSTSKLRFSCRHRFNEVTLFNKTLAPVRWLILWLRNLKLGIEVWDGNGLQPCNCKLNRKFLTHPIAQSGLKSVEV